MVSARPSVRYNEVRINSKERSNVDWDKLKREYVTTDISQRKLAKKYDIPYSNLSRMATKDKWSDARTQFKSRVNAKSLAKAEAKATDYKSMLYDLAYKVAQQLTDLVEGNDIETLISAGVKPRDITGAIKDLEDALHVKSAADLKEQEARIRKLQKEAEGTDAAEKNIEVKIDESLKDFAE